ncbi:MAG: hypothetical protein EOO14_15865 [Chitinophagaceae bacterium]|nr:MAG: hypothetical protein EOO14_15865 [Chitinophagaceae bacterium]
MQDLEFVFRTEEIKKLLDTGCEFIVIKSSIEPAVLQDGRKAGVLRVKAKAVNKGRKDQERSIGLKSIEVDGCPKPPCTTDEEDDGQP